MTAAQIIVRDLEVDDGRRVRLRAVDLDLWGGIAVVLGANGAGKTTLLQQLATVGVPANGTVTIDGLDPAHETDRREIRRRLGYLPQSGGLPERARLYDVVDLVAVLKEHRDDRRRRQLVVDALDAVGLRDRMGDRIATLSGGMRQRVRLAQALLGAPTLLVLDEPATALDPDERLRLRGLLGARRADTTVVVSTNLTDEAAAADRVVVLVDGTVCFVGTPAQLAARAEGRVWVQAEHPGPGPRAVWTLPGGGHRCLGHLPPGVTPVAPTLEEGYLLLQPAFADASSARRG